MHLTLGVERILFITPPNITFDEFVSPAPNVKHVNKANGRIVGSVITDIPLGPLSLSAYIKKHIPVETRLIDFNVALNREDSFGFSSFRDYFLSFLRDPGTSSFRPTIIGISAQFAPSCQNFMDIAECCKQLFPDALLLGGGNLPTTGYRQILQDTDAFDGICYGEGEKPMLALLQAADKLSYLKESPSWVTREKLLQEHEFRHDFIVELDEIPFLDYDLLDIDGYDINPTMHYYTSENALRKGIPMMTSRGCPFRCIFCAAHRTHGREMRYHSVARVAEDARKLKTVFGAQTIILLDDHFMSNSKRAYEIVDTLSSMDLSLFFPNALALYALDRRFLELLARVGVTQLILAVESGSDRVLKHVMHKPLKLDIVRRVASDCRELGIYTDCNILIGLPGETQKDITDAREFLKTIHADWFRINVATPLAGSEMYDICEEKKYFKDKPVLGNYKKAIIETEDFTAAYIQETSYLMNIELNFVHNANIKLGRYDTALESFNNVLKAKHDHPVALYCSGVCYQKLGNHDMSLKSFRLAENYARNNDFWIKIIRLFDIPIFQATETMELAHE
ncbi:MAG: radical SAM protein [Deltaproteobacteria bacterium]|nr:radical SAM protein [Deltaproteobacteria bacterium]